MAEPLLVVKGLNAWYGESHILHGMALQVYRGEVVTLLGRNGSGRSKLLQNFPRITSPRTSCS